MAKAVGLVFALCIAAIAAVAHGQQQEVFHVEGDVYCDPCRVQFVTELSQKLTGNFFNLITFLHQFENYSCGILMKSMAVRMFYFIWGFISLLIHDNNFFNIVK